MSARAWGLFAASSFLFGIPYLLNEVAIEGGMGPAEIAFGRCVVGALALLPIALATGALRVARGRWRSIMLFSALDMALPFVLISAGQRHISSSLAGVLVSTVPIFVALFALRFDPSERVDGIRAFGLAVGLIGLVLVLGVEVAGSATAAVGAAVVLLSSASYAVATLRYPRAFAGVDPIGVVCVALAMGAIWLLPVLILDVPTHVPSLSGIGALIALGLLCSAAGGWAYFTLIAVVGSARTSVITYVAPTIAVVGGVLVLGETLAAGGIAGLLLVLAGSWLATGGRPPPGARRIHPLRQRGGGSARPIPESRPADRPSAPLVGGC